MKKRFELDFLGQYYASTINAKNSGKFNITVHLKEPLNHKVLKQSLADLVERFPFLCGYLRRNFFSYEYEITSRGLPLIPIENISETESNKQVFRVLYGTHHFTVEVSHILFDGRTLSKIARALLIRYFELLGIDLDDNNTFTCNESQHPEESENAYLRFANSETKRSNGNGNNAHISQIKTPVYLPSISAISSARTFTYKLSASEVKAAAKVHEATVSEFLLSHIFKSIAAERAALKREEPIVAAIPIDCRSFFPSRTMRNFVSAQNITMPEVEDFATTIKQLRIEFSKIDKQSIYEDFGPLQKMYQIVRYVPRRFKDWYMKRVRALEATKSTTGFSNIGKLDFPETILERVDFMEFFIGLDEDVPYYFSCVTVGNVLALTVTLKVDNKNLIEALEQSLMKFVVA